MFSIIFEEKVIFSIDAFIDSYRDTFLNRFIDTGIFNEELIRKNYVDVSKEFRNNIYSQIKAKLQQEQVLGKMLLKQNFSVFITVGNYKMLIIYSESIESKTRFVETIEFYKK